MRFLRQTNRAQAVRDHFAGKQQAEERTEGRCRHTCPNVLDSSPSDRFQERVRKGKTWGPHQIQEGLIDRVHGCFRSTPSVAVRARLPEADFFFIPSAGG
jgi:hypothetical protein